MIPERMRIRYILGKGIPEALFRLAERSKDIQEMIKEARTCGFEVTIEFIFVKCLVEALDPTDSVSTEASEKKIKLTKKDAEFLKALKISLPKS